MSTTSYKWEGAGTPLPDGHKLFETHDDGYGRAGWAIADESGPTPDQTEDGVLWLDYGRCLRIGDSDALPTIPLLTEDGTETRTPTDCATILMLSRMLRWTIEDEKRGHYYEAR